MGVYIDMEMPETCKLCYLSEFDPGFYAFVCKPTGIRIDCDMAKIDRQRTICPLVPVPPHGRLGDLDALADYVHQQDDWLSETAIHAFCGILCKTPTIIEAEEGET